MKGIIPAGRRRRRVRESVRKSVHQHSDTPAPLGHVSGFLRVDQSYAPFLADLRLMAVVDRLFGEFFRISFVTGSRQRAGNQTGSGARGLAVQPKCQSPGARALPGCADESRHHVDADDDYTVENRGTLVIPGSHKLDHSPQDRSRVDPNAKYEGEVQLVGKAGDVGLFDARTWHAIAPNVSDHERVGFIVRYAPWWINLQPLRPGSRDRRQINDANGGDDSKVEPVPLSVYERLPENLKPLVYHMGSTKATEDLRNCRPRGFFSGKQLEHP